MEIPTFLEDYIYPIMSFGVFILINPLQYPVRYLIRVRVLTLLSGVACFAPYGATRIPPSSFNFNPKLFRKQIYFLLLSQGHNIFCIYKEQTLFLLICIVLLLLSSSCFWFLLLDFVNFKLRKIVFVLGKQFIGHLLDLGQR